MTHEERFAKSKQDGTSPGPEGINSPQLQVGTPKTPEEQPANPPQANQEVFQDGTSPGPEENNSPQPQVGTPMTPEEQPANPPQANQEVVQDGTSPGPEEIISLQPQVGTSMAPEEQPANPPQVGAPMAPEEQPANPPQVGAPMAPEVQPANPPQVGAPMAPEEQPANPPLEALKKRVQLFSEGLVKMASPVLLALTTKKGNIFFRGSISLFAAITLGGGIILFVWLWLSSLLTGGPKKVMYFASKLLVHLCGMVLMALASDILLLISMDKKLCLLVLIPPFSFTFLCCFWSMHLDENEDSKLYRATKCEAELEISVDFTASVTTLLFLGLGRFALEIGTKGSDHLADLAVGIFVICVFGVYFTLYGTIPLLPRKEGEKLVLLAIESFDILLAAAVSVMVFWITWVIIKAWACLLTLPPLASLFTWAFFACGQGDQEQQEDDHRQMDPEGNQQQQQQQPPGSGETKPAPLELTKATFTGFLLVAAVQSPNNGSISNSMHAFIFLTAGAVVSGLLWRFLTHRTKPLPAVVTATNVASFFAHSCLAAAVVPFALLARKA